MKIPTPEERAKALLRIERQTSREVAKCFSDLVDRVTAKVGAFPPGVLPLFAEGLVDVRSNPAFARMLDSELTRFAGELEEANERGVTRAWTLSDHYGDLDMRGYLKRTGATALLSRYTLGTKEAQTAHRAEAMRAFLDRRDRKGFTTSGRVWRTAEQAMLHIETSLSEGLAEGRSAAELSRTIRQDLREPDRLFRRVRDKNGNLQLSKPAQAYHPGQGVYRSSYKNALRLTRTEINVSYAEADFERWQRLDFVIGYEVRLSNNHTCNGHPFTDICDELAGKYPKWFKFTKWHPQCRCVCLAIFDDDPGAGEVRDVPANFKQWVTDNRPRLDRSIKKGTAPYWVRDNFTKQGKLTGAGKGNFADVSEKLRKAVAPIPSSGHLYVSFEPFSPLITEYLHKAKGRRQKTAIFESILNDERAKTIHATDTAKTTLYPLHRGRKQPSWGETAKAAQALNRHGINVSFLPEYESVSSADAIIGAGKKWTLADFKATTTRNGHTLYKELEKGFEQAHTIVLKMGDGDAGTFRDAIEELKRKGSKMGNVVLVTEYGKVVELQANTLRTKKYISLIKGKL